MNIIDQRIYEAFEPWPLDLGGWNGTAAIFDELIAQVKPAKIIEVGTWKGQSALHMVDCLKARGLTASIICVDTWLGAEGFWGKLKHTRERDLRLRHGYPQVYYQFLSNVVHKQAQQYILPFPATSLIAARVLQEQQLQADLIYIDGSHEEEDVFQDICEYWKLLRAGGVIFGDDLGWKTSRGSLVNAVRRFADLQKLGLSLKQGDHFWIMNKPGDEPGAQGRVWGKRLK